MYSSIPQHTFFSASVLRGVILISSSLLSFFFFCYRNIEKPPELFSMIYIARLLLKGALSQYFRKMWKAKRYVLISDNLQTMIPLVVYKWAEATYCCRWPRMTQLNRDYNLKMLCYPNIFKFCHCEWEISPEKKNTLGESLDIFLLWLQRCSLFWTKVLGHNFPTILTRNQQNCRDTTPLRLL